MMYTDGIRKARTWGTIIPRKNSRGTTYEARYSDLDLDDLAFLFRQVRIYCSHRCNILPDWFSGQLPIYRVLHFHLDNGATYCTT